MKRAVVVLVLVAGIAGVSAQQPPAPPPSVTNFFNEFTTEWVHGNPNLAASTRYFSGAEQDAFESQITPETAEYRASRVALAKKGLEQLATFDRARMSEADRLSADLLQWQLHIVVDAEKYSDYSFPLEQFGGANVNLPNILIVNHPLNTEKDAEHYIARLYLVSARMYEAIAEAKKLAAKNMIPPRFIIRATITQMQQFIGTPAAKNPLVTTFDQRVAASKAVPDATREAMRGRAEKIVREQLYPSWKQGIALLQSLVGKATDDAGLWRFKGGDAAYAFALRRFTTTSLTADQIHEIGLKRVAELEKQMDEIFRQIGKTQGSVKDRIAQLKKEEAYPLTEDGRTQIMADANAMIRDAEKRAALMFDKTPKAPVEARPFPKFREANAAANYTSPPSDGSRPGIVQIPLRPERMTKFGLRTLLYHEGVPGHHFQIALEGENTAQPRFRRVRAFGAISALVEGWGLYAERLAAESDWYKDDPIGLLGQLDSELFRARRLVVDTGIHAKHWTRQQAIDYGIEASEIERYVVNPGQACSYMMGELKLLEMRDKAKKTLGDKFNIRDFHTAVLSAGSLPLVQVECAVDAYLRKATAVASLPKGEQVVPVYHEPHHRQLFAHDTTRILEGQFPPGDTSWYHSHNEPILYLTLSTSTQRTQNLGDDWNRGRGGEGGAPAAAPPASRGAPPAGRGVRPASTTSYYDSPITHRIQNVGDRLYRFMAITNASAGDESGSDEGFQGRPELNNRWFRAYRIIVPPGGKTEPHRHSGEAVIVSVNDGKGVAVGPMTWEFSEQGSWAWFDKDTPHEIRNTGTTPLEVIEVDVRH
ncbi:MAG: DUF885 domain-containing protein [Blastocatellia bacterium]|nr:MAG: DUF885 domain-containing protein [Blastocatellia bacterium]